MMNKTKKVWYVIGGPKDNCRVLHYYMFESNSVREDKWELGMIQDDYPGQTYVLVDATADIKTAYMLAKKRGSYAAWIEFYDYVSRMGLVV